MVKEAYAYYEMGEYDKSGKRYSEAFQFAGDKGYVTDRYNAACSWALAGEPDSAFKQLFRISRKGNWTNLDHLLSDTDLYSLHPDPRWNEVVDVVKVNKEKAEEHYNQELIAELDTIYRDDQDLRKEYGAVELKFGAESPEVRAHIQKIVENDSINLIKVKSILDEYGWPGPDIIGRKGNSALFLVIQHADLETQEQYLPMMRDAVEDGNASAADLALLEDRVALREGKRQIYGSQIGYDEDRKTYYVLPLEDPDNVNARRREVGLGPIEEYISNWGLTWDVESYKLQLPEIESRYLEQRK